ncbi:lysophospholipase L1-like esterase [Litoreibacter halocynthiae]|uniref:Lysophospholipase L1-like esterase n=1 Tax=Litoreibacter halocynthiae TaxID=1242689 RepID=A0A4R7LPT8_9RHOB|nr:SGNH/GDSL hydrolase family protein [Litoreibacter halocynthiae]TDT77499.1 lysophospholipase L1-like esterase [Litoreibacter halocynthiae]
MRDAAVKLALLPLLAAQGWRARKSARQLPEPDGPREGIDGEGPLLRLLVLGDSSAAGVGVAHQREAIMGRLVQSLSQTLRVAWRLNAVSGATTGATLARLTAEETGPFDMAVVALGVNDITKGATLRRWLGQQRELCERLRTDFGCAHVFVSGVPPIGSFPLLPDPLRWVLAEQGRRWDRALIAMLDGMDGCHHVKAAESLAPDQMAEDGFHPGAEVYEMWADAILKQLRPLL